MKVFEYVEQAFDVYTEPRHEAAYGAWLETFPPDTVHRVFSSTLGGEQDADSHVTTSVSELLFAARWILEIFGDTGDEKGGIKHQRYFDKRWVVDKKLAEQILVSDDQRPIVAWTRRDENVGGGKDGGTLKESEISVEDVFRKDVIVPGGGGGSKTVSPVAVIPISGMGYVDWGPRIVLED